jgi:hypothetical protein
MRKYEKPGIKSCSDADIGYAISERGASAEPQIVSEPEGNMYEFSPCHNFRRDNNNLIHTTTTLLKYDQNDNDSSKIELTENQDEVKRIETFEQSLKVRPKINEFEAKNIVKKTEDKRSKNASDTKIQIKLTTIYPNDSNGSSFRDENWIFYGKKPSNANAAETNKPEGKYETTSSILLNNDFSSNENTKTMNHTSAIEIMPSTMVTNLDGNYYFAEDTTLRTLTNSSCHSDRSLVQLNLVCCEIDNNKDENEKGSSRISEEEEEGNTEISDEKNKVSMNLDSKQTNLKCNLNQESHALKSYSHLPSSYCSTSADTLEEKSFVNSCEINLITSKKEFSLNLDEMSENSIKSSNDDCLEHKKQEAELSNILENMINEIEENSRSASTTDQLGEHQDTKILINNEDDHINNKKNKTAALLLAALNSKTIGTIIYENSVDKNTLKSEKKQNEKKNDELNELKIQANDKQLLSKSSKLNSLRGINFTLFLIL